MTAWLVLLLAAVSPPEAEVQQFFDALAEHRAGIRVLDARFTQVYSSPDEFDEAEGTLRYASPRRVLIRYADPEVIYLIDDNMLYEYDPELKQADIHRLGDDPRAEALFLGFNEDPERLLAAYHVTVVQPSEDDCGPHGLELRPKTQEDEGPFFEKAVLHFRAPDYVPCRVHIATDDESWVDIAIRDVVVNGPADANTLRVFLPEGTVIVDNVTTTTRSVGPGGVWLPAAPPAESAPGPEPQGAAAP